MEFWNDSTTEKSWQKLVELRGELDFVLIGGWAVYLYTNLSKSKDIDMIVDYGALRLLSSRYKLLKNDRLKKYEIKFDDFDVDIYLPKYSRLAIPPEDVMAKFRKEVAGFVLPVPEALLTLKISAFLNRKESIKGDKDLIDMIGLLFFSKLDIDTLKNMGKNYHTDCIRTLLSALEGFGPNMARFLNLNEKSLADLKRKYTLELRKAL